MISTNNLSLGNPRLFGLKLSSLLFVGFFMSIFLVIGAPEAVSAENFNIEITSAARDVGNDKINVKYKVNNGSEQSIALDKLNLEPGYAKKLGISGGAQLTATLSEQRATFSSRATRAMDSITFGSNAARSITLTLSAKAPSAKECYGLDGKVRSDISAELQDACRQAGYCVDNQVIEAGRPKPIFRCSDSIYKNSDAYKRLLDMYNSESLRTAQTRKLIEVICSTIPEGVQFNDAREGCENQVRDQYFKCVTATGNASMANVTSPTTASVTSCMQGWAKTNYPKAKPGDIDRAIQEGLKNAETEVERQRIEEQVRADKAACERKGEGFLWNSSSNACEESGGLTKDVQCAGGALGWIFCPLMDMASAGIEAGINALEGFMRFEPLMGTQQGDAVFSVWRMVVGMANLALVAAFLVVIFSQATSVGLSSYGIKKMLPRIIAAAILINISFYLCAILVDVFNIIGASIAGIVQSAVDAIPTPAVSKGAPSGFAPYLTSLTALAFGVTVLAITKTLAFLLPLALTVMASVLFILVVLGLRHTLALLLIIISPLAFAAMILPNTDGLFKKWWKALWITLALYPIIMGLAYGSMLVSKILLTATPVDSNGDPDGLVGLLHIGIAVVIPVAWVFALKFIVTWGSGLVGKIGGMVNDRNKGLIDKSRKWADRRSGERQQLLKDRKMERMGKRSGGIYGMFERNLTPTGRRIVREERNRIASEGGKIGAARTASTYYKSSSNATVKARAEAMLDEIETKEAKIKLDFEFSGNADDAIKSAIKRGDSALMKLSAQKLVDSGQLQTLHKYMTIDEDKGGMNNDQVKAVATNLLNGGYMPKMKAQDQSMKYALPAMANGDVAEGWNSKEVAMKLSAGNSKYDQKAMGANNSDLISQEQYVVERQREFDVLNSARANEINGDATIQKDYKKDRKDAISKTPGNVGYTWPP